MVKTRNDSRIEIWADSYINNIKNCRKDADINVDIVQIESVGDGYNYMVEIVDKKNPDENEKYNGEAFTLIFETGKANAASTIIHCLKEECKNPNRDWSGNKTYTEIIDFITEIRDEFSNNVDAIRNTP
jgi:hypothetical protein